MAQVLETVKGDDYVEYFLFFREVDDVVNANELPKLILQTKRARVLSVVEKYSKDYIWHRDPFTVIEAEAHSGKEHLPPHLYGITYYGENIEDEWFIVYLLIQLTKEIDDLVVRVVDADGEFLLVEAAEFLPQWANPDTCEQRVYLYQGCVHIVPWKQINIPRGQVLSVRDAVVQVRQQPQATVAAPAIQSAIQKRISRYPKGISELLHRATVFVPAGVAALLNTRPGLVTAAVRAFCNRDPLDMKACRAMRYFPPESRVMTSVVFTKCLYAMLLHERFVPDSRTGWNMPPLTSKEYKAHSLGVKLACGFEILASQAKPSNLNMLVQESNDLDTHKSWNQFLQSLKKTGYFQDYLEGSKNHKQLLEKARQFYNNQQDSFPPAPDASTEVLTLLKTVDINIDELKSAERNLPPSDDESWLQINPHDLDKMLEERYGGKSLTTVSSKSDPVTISSHLTTFLDHMSEVEGAEVPGSLEESRDTSPPIRPKRGVKLHKGKGHNASLGSAEEGGSTPETRVNFDSSSFSCAVQNILDFHIPEDSWDLESDGSGMSSYEDETEMDLDQLKKGNRAKEAEPESELKQYMDQMDQELAGTTIGHSFEKKSKQPRKKDDDDSFDDIESFDPVDIDMNALKNMLRSYQSQMGEAGPASSLLGPMGVKLDPDPDSDSL